MRNNQQKINVVIDFTDISSDSLPPGEFIPPGEFVMLIPEAPRPTHQLTSTATDKDNTKNNISFAPESMGR